MRIRPNVRRPSKRPRTIRRVIRETGGETRIRVPSCISGELNIRHFGIYIRIEPDRLGPVLPERMSEMTRNQPLAFPILTALLISTAAATAASAQSVPPADGQNRAAVREILNRAETEARRRSLGDILGGIAGVSQAAAQTAPPVAPGSAPPASRQAAVGSPAPASQQGTGPAGANAGPGQATRAAAVQRPQAVAQATQSPPRSSRPLSQDTSPVPSVTGVSGRGTASDPSMIATAPPSNAGSAPTAPEAQNGAPGPVAFGAPSDGPRRVSAAGEPRTVLADRGPRHRELRFGRSEGYSRGGAWCEPYRW